MTTAVKTGASGESPAATTTYLERAVAAEVRALMSRKMMRDAELALALGQNQQWFSRRKLGRVPFTAGELVMVATYLGVPPSALLDGLSDPDPDTPTQA